ncbi:AMP-binding protein [Psychromonas marina]|uniref:AMP-binding protein n=1 Tax=Psychromonas marina TaxID=88364 RepID=A0ABQ6E1E9_9GAMM|nr:AMP-binding protein [Psychromonas marina]GLS91043.1 AMP-binding protein [Psychromonas marina]
MTIQLENNTLAALTERSTSLYEDKLLVSNIDDIEITYAQAGEKIALLHSIFQELGIKQGDKVAICSENMPHWGIVYLAITSMGAVVVPILPDFHLNEVQHIIKHAEVVALFVSKKINAKFNEDGYSSPLQYVFSLESLELLEDKTSKHSELVSKIALFKEKALHLAHLRSDSQVLSIDENDLASIIYTSGTTGQSKGVMLSHKNIISQFQQIQSMVGIHSEDKFLSILPLAHTYECSAGFIVPFSTGASIHYISKVPSPKIILAAMQKVQPTCMLSVPLVIEKIYKSKVQAQFNKNRVIKYLYENVTFVRKQLNKIAGKKLEESFGGQMRLFGVGGSKLSPFVEAFLSEANFPYAIGYGLTETAPIIAAAAPGCTKVGTTGLIVPDVEYRFNKQSEDQRDGELHVRGPNIMMGYYKDAVRTAEVLDEDGWLNTGDLGYIDENGILTINGRSKNVIIGASGENIYPEAVESVINQHALVLDSFVYELEHKVVAKIHIDYEQFDDSHNISKTSDSALHSDILSLLEEIRTTVNTQLSSYSKITKVTEQREPFITTPTKKIKRYLHT